ncbi:YqjF family protein [Halogranum rubrum]|nr:DUF2071 domain-containing protein [Halogranum salarium]
MHRDLMSMTWLDGLFLHWPVDPALVEERIPAGLDVATYDGDAWLGVVAFEMPEIRPRGSPIRLGFPEVNLRTYVEPAGGGERGVYFFNLDAGDVLGVAMARLFFALPYYHADMHVSRDGDEVHFTHQRTNPHARPAEFDAVYRPTGSVASAEPGSLDEFLVENYRFYTERSGLWYCPIRHDPWPLQDATVDVRVNTLFEANGFERPAGEPLVHYAGELHVTADRLHRV